MTDQLKIWKGEFGEAYTDRNALADWRVKLPAFQKMLEGLSIKKVLEVGCNRGYNLLVLAELLGKDSEVIGIEPNRYALELARAASVKVGALYGHTFDIPFKNAYFDLTVTSGVLIHISLIDLPKALREIYRVSKQYILAIEYWAPEETTIHYRGYDNLLWKRDFLSHYKNQFPGLTLIRSGYWGPEDGFDRCHWWLFEKI
jgi:pseudaminic acid biosynthesis-associated methylase